MAEITIHLDYVEENERKRQRNRARNVTLLFLAAFASLAFVTAPPREIVVPGETKTVTVVVEVPAAETFGPPQPLIVIREVPVTVTVAPEPRPQLNPRPAEPTDPAKTETVVADVLSKPDPTSPDPPRVRLQPAIEPLNVHFTRSQLQRVAISNPYREPVAIESIEPMGVNGAPVRGYNIDSRKCLGKLAPGGRCFITVFASPLAVRSAETIQIKVNVAEP